MRHICSTNISIVAFILVIFQVWVFSVTAGSERDSIVTIIVLFRRHLETAKCTCAMFCSIVPKLHVILREKLQKSESLSTSAILHKSVSAYVHIIQTYKIIDISETQLQSFCICCPSTFQPIRNTLPLLQCPSVILRFVPNIVVICTHLWVNCRRSNSVQWQSRWSAVILWSCHRYLSHVLLFRGMQRSGTVSVKLSVVNPWFVVI